MTAPNANAQFHAMLRFHAMSGAAAATAAMAAPPQPPSDHRHHHQHQQHQQQQQQWRRRVWLRPRPPLALDVTHESLRPELFAHLLDFLYGGVLDPSLPTDVVMELVGLADEYLVSAA
jgi:hypothetical protein